MPALTNKMFEVEIIRSFASSKRFTECGVFSYGRDPRIQAWNSELQTKYILSGFLMFAFMMVALFSLRGMTQTFYPRSPLLADAGPVVFALILPLSFRGGGGFIYDFSELGLLSLGLHMLLANHLTLFLAVLPLMVINKESNIIILLFSIIVMFSRLSKVKALLHLMVQGVVGLIPFFLVKWHFADHPGGAVEFQLWDNLRFWLKPSSYSAFMTTSVFFIPFPNPSNVLLAPLLGWLAFSKWHEKPALLRTLFVAAVFINLPLLLLFCYRDEFRNLSLVFPIYYLLGCHTLLRLYQQTALSQNCQPHATRRMSAE